MWNWCKYCDRRIEVGELCFGLPDGSSVCTGCCKPENGGQTTAADFCSRAEPKRRARWEKDRCGDWKCTNCGEFVPDKGMQPWFAPWCPACGFAMEGQKDEKAV